MPLVVTGILLNCEQDYRIHIRTHFYKCVPLGVRGTLLIFVERMTRTNLEVYHDVAVQPLESQSRSFVFVFFAAFLFLLLCVLWAS